MTTGRFFPVATRGTAAKNKKIPEASDAFFPQNRTQKWTASKMTVNLYMIHIKSSYCRFISYGLLFKKNTKTRISEEKSIFPVCHHNAVHVSLLSFQMAKKIIWVKEAWWYATLLHLLYGPIMRKSKTFSASVLGEQLQCDEWAIILDSGGLGLSVHFG